jgi:hypothetical protein
MQQGNTLKILKIMHKALLIGQVLFTAVCAYLVYAKIWLPVATELNKVLQVAALAAAAGGIYGGMFLFKKKLAEIGSMQEAKEKFAAYRSACLLQWALMEGPSLFCTISFFITGNYAFLALVIAIAFVFTMTAPSKLKMQLQLQASEAEMEEL